MNGDGRNVRPDVPGTGWVLANGTANYANNFCSRVVNLKMIHMRTRIQKNRTVPPAGLKGIKVDKDLGMGETGCRSSPLPAWTGS